MVALERAALLLQLAVGNKQHENEAWLHMDWRTANRPLAVDEMKQGYLKVEVQVYLLAADIEPVDK